ncbi:MAG: hypothetical protein OEZ54_08060, partial [Gemmatimonadota bacterium]|nr:hypothetical protein [Gemmatimonadota bacterium]
LALALKTELPKLQSHSGTPEFAAPEQMFGEEVDHRADLYSLSLVGYFALTGRPPFAGDSVEAVLAHKEAGDLPKVHPIRNDVPETVLWALARGASRNPEERFPTAAAYLQALQRAAHEGQTTPKSWFRNMLGGG